MGKDGSANTVKRVQRLRATGLAAPDWTEQERCALNDETRMAFLSRALWYRNTSWVEQAMMAWAGTHRYGPRACAASG